VLAETGELELAAATFEGALGFHPDFADVHFHLANTLERLDRRDEAEAHYRAFLELAPESPWAEAARDRLALASIAR
jgi:tetratricopeptide (TPR) repeat protein